MWAQPDNMAAMLAQKIGPSAIGRQHRLGSVAHGGDFARLLHYHQVNVAERQRALKDRAPARLDDILTIPLSTQN